MSIQYYASGFAMDHCFANEFGEKIVRDIKRRKLWVVVPATDDAGFNQEHVQFVRHQFEEIGLSFENITVLNEAMSIPEMKDAIHNADFLYLMGGYPFYQKEFIVKHDILEAIRNYTGVILGISSGAMNMSQYIIMVTDGPNSDEVKIESGLGMTDFSIFPHFSVSDNKVGDSFFIGQDKVDTDILLEVSKNLGKIYFLQNKNDLGDVKISLIRVEDGKKEIVRINGGNIWTIEDEKYKLV